MHPKEAAGGKFFRRFGMQKDAGLGREGNQGKEGIMNRERESNYDLLRIVSAVAVIAIHISGFYVNNLVIPSVSGTNPDGGMITEIYLYNTLSRFAVPCFVMLSGAFLLADERNADYKYFYKKALKHVGIPAAGFSLFYFAVSMAFSVAVMSKGDFKSLLPPVMDFIKGEPFYHMWYLYMLIGVYLLVPVVIRLKRDIGEQNFSRVVKAFFVLAVISSWTSSHAFRWDIGYSFCYLGYFMAGYEIRKTCGERARHGNGTGACLLLAGIFFGLVTVYLRYGIAMDGVLEEELRYDLTDPYAPLVAAASLCIFTGFSMIRVKKDFGKLSSYTFLIYLCHAGIWYIGELAVTALFGCDAYRIVIPISIALVFFFSCLCAVACKKSGEKMTEFWTRKKTSHNN